MATNNSIFEFGDLFGIESPLGNWTPTAEKGFIQNYSTNFPELMNYLKTNRAKKTSAPFDYTKFYGYKEVERNAGHGETYTRKDPETIPYSFQPPDQDESHKRKLNLKFIPNKHKADIDFSRKPHFKLYFDEQEEYIRYSVGLWYSNPTGQKDEDIFALYIQALDYPSFLDLLSDLDLHITPEGQHSIRKVFETAFSQMAGKINRLDWLYEQAPDYVLCERKRNLLETDLKLLLSGNVNEWGTNEEVAVLNILNGLAGIRSDRKEIAVGAINDTLRIMQSGMTKNKTVFEVLYSKLNDTGGRPNFTRFIQTVYKFWLVSDYSSPDAYRYNGEPELIPYQGNKILGFYQDGYSFSFYNDGIAAFKTENFSLLSILKEVVEHPLAKPVPKVKEIEPFATYGLFQPLQLPELDQKGEIALPDTIIPAFYLKAFDDKKAWADFEKSIWLGVDIVTTLTGFGNLLKLRHLKHLQTTIEYIRIASGTLQVASGIVGTMLNFVNDCNGEGFCAKLRKYLFWLDLATFSVDAITGKMIKNSAREAFEAMPEKLQKQERGIAEHLDEVGETNKFIRYISSGGKRGEIPLTIKQKEEIIEYAVKYGIDKQNIIFKNDDIMNTCFGRMYDMDFLYINTDVMPAAKNLISANSKVSWKGAIAHELEGHRAAVLAGKTHSNDLLEEAQASIRASLHGKELTNEERKILMDDARERLEKNSINLETIISELWLEKY